MSLNDQLIFVRIAPTDKCYICRYFGYLSTIVHLLLFSDQLLAILLLFKHYIFVTFVRLKTLSIIGFGHISEYGFFQIPHVKVNSSVLELYGY